MHNQCHFNTTQTTSKTIYYSHKLHTTLKAMTLHCLNALRVIAEFVMVSSHLTSVENTNSYPHSFGGAGALMSFFFILSGFVATYSHKAEGVNSQYLTRRLNKTYPLFFLTWALGLPACITDKYVRKKKTCIVQRWIYLCLQPLCLETFLGWHIEGSNPPMWYYTSLVFMWAIYSYIDVKKWMVNHPLKRVVILYIASLLLSYPFFIFDGSSIQQLPFLHTFEFFMGCAAAVSVNQKNSTRGEIPAILFII
jgi:peptidoglycan/LPS O-acetylase OafA/YrhL